MEIRRKTHKEKYVDKKLRDSVKALGGISIKLVTIHISGLPDRLNLLPKGRIFFAEIKETGKKPERIQTYIARKLIKLGFDVYCIDHASSIPEILNKYR